MRSVYRNCRRVQQQQLFQVPRYYGIVHFIAFIFLHASYTLLQQNNNAGALTFLPSRSYRRSFSLQLFLGISLTVFVFFQDEFAFSIWCISRNSNRMPVITTEKPNVNRVTAFVGKMQPCISRRPEIPPVNYAKGGCDFRCPEKTSSFGKQVYCDPSHTYAFATCSSTLTRYYRWLHAMALNRPLPLSSSQAARDS